METQRPGPTGETVDTPQHRALSSASRVAILRLVRASPSGMTTGEVATATTLHLSTARAHLDRLVSAGLLVRRRSGGGVPGRPAWRYHAAAPDPAPAPYRALAAALLAHLAETDVDVWRTAVQTGEGWGTELATTHTEVGPVNAVIRVLDGLGFAPLRLATTERGDGAGAANAGAENAPSVSAGAENARSVSAGTDAAGDGAADRVSSATRNRLDAGGDQSVAEIRLRSCPFLELVADHAETMCGLHLGVVRGVLAGRGSTDTDAVLLPFGAPDACVLRLVGAAGARL